MYFINLGKTIQRLEAMIRGEHICHFLIKSLRVESKLTSYFCAIPIQWATLQFLTNFTKTPGWLPWNLFRHALDCSAIQFFQTRLEEYLPREGADQCTAGIQLKWIGDSQTIKYFAVLYMLIQTSQTGDQPYRDWSFPLEWVFLDLPQSFDAWAPQGTCSTWAVTCKRWWCACRTLVCP